MGFDWVLVVGWVGREMGLEVFWLVVGRVALMEMWVLGQGGWLVGLLLPNWTESLDWVNDN